MTASKPEWDLEKASLGEPISVPRSTPPSPTWNLTEPHGGYNDSWDYYPRRNCVCQRMLLAVE